MPMSFHNVYIKLEIVAAPHQQYISGRAEEALLRDRNRPFQYQSCRNRSSRLFIMFGAKIYSLKKKE